MTISHFQSATKSETYQIHVQAPVQWAYILLKVSRYIENSNYLLICLVPSLLTIKLKI